MGTIFSLTQLSAEIFMAEDCLVSPPYSESSELQFYTFSLKGEITLLDYIEISPKPILWLRSLPIASSLTQLHAPKK